MFKALLGALALACAASPALAARSIGLQVLTLEPSAADWDRLAFPTLSFRPNEAYAQALDRFALRRPDFSIPHLDTTGANGWPVALGGLGGLLVAFRLRRGRARRLVIPGALAAARRGGRRRRNP